MSSAPKFKYEHHGMRARVCACVCVRAFECLRARVCVMVDCCVGALCARIRDVVGSYVLCGGCMRARTCVRASVF